jgi:hypothetical protein
MNFLQCTQVIEGAPDQGLEAPPIKREIIRGVNPGLFRFTQRLGLRRPQRNDNDLRPLRLHLLEQIATLARPQIDEEKRGIILLQHRREPIGFCDVTEESAVAQESAAPPNEIVILRVEETSRVRDHAAATSS